MQRSSGIFITSENQKREDLGAGLSRKILGWDPSIMMVSVSFEKGATGDPHSHIHAQTTYILSGRFEFTVGNEKRTVAGGDALYIPPQIVHGAVCLESGELIDVFSPVREDFLR